MKLLPVYYITWYSNGILARPNSRVTDKEEAIKEVNKQREQGFPAVYMNASEYRRLTGRVAYKDYLNELE